MKIAIIVAMSKELKLLLPLLQEPSVVVANNYEFHLGQLGSHEVIAVQCGIGKVNAAISTLTLIENFHPDMVINTGVAGGTGGGAKILDVVIADRISYHDCWCGLGTEWGEAAGCPRYFKPLTLADLIPDSEALSAHDKVKHGLIASGDIFVSRKEDIEHILSVFPDAIAVDMESGAIAQTCFIKNVPFFCIRVVSDTPGESDNISQYENFWEDAPQSTFHILHHIITSLK